MQSNTAVLFLILVFAAVFTAAQALGGLVRHGGVRRKVNRRLALAERIGSLTDLVVELRKQRGLTETGERRLAWVWLADLILKSGVVYAPRRWAGIVALAGLGGGVAAFVLTRNPIAALAAAPIAAAGGPIAYLVFKAKTRAKRLGAQLPDALEVVVRSLEAGHPVATAVGLVGREMPDPIGSEFGMAADEIAFGGSLENAVGRMADRCRHPDLDLFAATIRLQERAGGNLMGLLKTNAHTIRERQRMRLKIHAASGEGRASAMILTAAPFCVMGMLQVTAPHFYGEVIHEPGVRIGLVVLGVWMFLGNMVMRRMINMKI